jgi:hypothetical protein
MTGAEHGAVPEKGGEKNGEKSGEKAPEKPKPTGAEAKKA